MRAEYAAVYGGPPAPTCAWPIVLDLAMRMAQFDARALLASVVGSGVGASQMFGGSGNEVQSLIRTLKAEAYPGHEERKGPVFALKQSRDDG